MLAFKHFLNLCKHRRQQRGRTGG